MFDVNSVTLGRPDYYNKLWESQVQPGWKAPVTKKYGRGYMTGILHQAGCFSFIEMPDGRLDVCVYADAPEEIARRNKAGENTEGKYYQTDVYPGWGHKAWDLAAKAAKAEEEYLKSQK